MAYEIDQEEDERTVAPPAAPMASAPAAAGAVSSAPSTSASPAQAPQGSRFVGFDRLLAMNTPSAQNAAGQLTSGVNQQYEQAQGALGTASEDFRKQAQAGVSQAYSNKGGAWGFAPGQYKGPTEVPGGAFDNARGLAREGQQQAQALGTVEGTQALLQRQGQTPGAARYNALFVNQFAAPQAKAAQERFAGFDGLLQGARDQGQQAINGAQAQQDQANQQARADYERAYQDAKARGDQYAKDNDPLKNKDKSWLGVI